MRRGAPLRATPIAAALFVVSNVAAAQARPDSAAARSSSRQLRAYVRDAGPGVAGRLLRETLGRPHTVVVASDTGIVLSRGTDVATTLLVIGGPARLEGRVRGDVVVLGDLVLRPGATIDGRALVFGGVLVNSSLAIVRGGRETFTDVGFRPTQTAPGQLALDYSPLSAPPARTFALPGLFGVRPPSYDRVDGLSLAFGPTLTLADGRLTIEPVAAYRSQLGVVDASLAADWRPVRRLTIGARAARGTYTNDAWVYSDLVNAATTIYAGYDTRNYYRADRGELTVTRTIETTSAFVEPFVGALVEHAWSVVRDSLAGSAPYSLFGRDDAVEGMRRPNPAVTGGTIASGLVGVRAQRPVGPITASGAIRVEAPVAAPGVRRFVQITGDGHLSFPTFRDQRFQAFAHLVSTSGDRAPSQRYAYIGGAATVPTLRLLEQGGDDLLWIESRYAIPIGGLRLPVVGSPTVMLRHILGGAGVDHLPALTQNVGLRVSVAMLRADIVLDPAQPRRHRFGVGLSAR